MGNAFQAVMNKAAQPEAAAKAPRTPRPAKPAEVKRSETVQAEALPQSEPAAKAFRPVREGKRFVGAHVPPEVLRQIKRLGIDEDKTVQELMEQAIDLLFVKYGKAKAAELMKG